MSNAINISQVERHLDIMDGRAKGDSELYRHFMSKDEDSGKVDERSYLVGGGYGDIINWLDDGQHQYVTLSLFSDPDVRQKSTIRAASGLYVDLDDKLYSGDDRISLELVHKSLTRARIPEPTMVIHSGGGWHVYWLFKDLFYFNTDGDIKKYESVIVDIIDSLTIIGADPKAKGSNRLLRLAGTYNKKNHYETSPAVMILESNDLYYDIGDFEGLHVVKKLPQEYHQSNKTEVKKSILTQDEPTAIKESIKQPRVISQSLTRPDEDFPLYLVGYIIIDAQLELERRNPQARYMEDVNQSVMVDLLVNYVSLPRNTYTFEDGSAGQYILEGHRSHFLWMLSRRGVTYKHLDIINRTLLLPSLNHREFNNAVGAWRTMSGIPKINVMVRDLGLTVSEQSVMATLRVDYGAALDKHIQFLNTRVNQLITESHQQYILASPGKTSKELAVELGISTRWVNQVRKQKGGGEVMSREQRQQEVRDMYRDIGETSRRALEEIYANYIIAGEALDKIIHNQGLIHSLRVPLTPEQREDIFTMASGLIAKATIIISQIDAYEEFISDDSEYFKSGKIKKTVLLDKVNKLKDSVESIQELGAI